MKRTVNLRKSHVQAELPASLISSTDILVESESLLSLLCNLRGGRRDVELLADELWTTCTHELCDSATQEVREAHDLELIGKDEDVDDELDVESLTSTKAVEIATLVVLDAEERDLARTAKVAEDGGFRIDLGHVDVLVSFLVERLTRNHKVIDVLEKIASALNGRLFLGIRIVRAAEISTHLGAEGSKLKLLAVAGLDLHVFGVV